MAYSKLEQERIAAGRCMVCGGIRLAIGHTKLRCAVCAEKQRETLRRFKERHPETREKDKQADRDYQTQQRAFRAENKLCGTCGGPRGSTLRTHATDRACGKCIEADRKRGAAYRARKREAASGVPVAPWPVGNAVPRLVGGRTIRFMLDPQTITAYEELKRRYQVGEQNAGRPPQTHQMSRLIRQAILSFENTPCPPLKNRKNLLMSHAVGIRLDARTWAILEQQARSFFGGNRSDALRTLIQCAARPFPKSAGRRPLW